jgi:2TM domain
MAYEPSDADARRVRSEVRRFKENVLVYIAVMAVLVVANVIAGGFWYAHFWLFWIALIWGVFIALQGVRLFGEDIGRDWEDRMVSHVMARRRGETTPPPPPRQPGAGARTQPAPPPRPPTPAWPPSSAAARPAPPPSGQPIVTPPPGHDPQLEGPKEQGAG